MIEEFDDYQLMCSNLAKLGWSNILALRVSKEHYAWLARAPSVVRSIVHTVGGTVEGHPTSEINVLQRIRQLVEIERSRGDVGTMKED